MLPVAPKPSRIRDEPPELERAAHLDSADPAALVHWPARQECRCADRTSATLVLEILQVSRRRRQAREVNRREAAYRCSYPTTCRNRGPKNSSPCHHTIRSRRPASLARHGSSLGLPPDADHGLTVTPGPQGGRFCTDLAQHALPSKQGTRLARMSSMRGRAMTLATAKRMRLCLSRS